MYPIWGWALTGRNNHCYLESNFKDVQFQSSRASVSASKTVRVLLQKFCNLNKTKHTHCEVPPEHLFYKDGGGRADHPPYRSDVTTAYSPVTSLVLFAIVL